MSPLLRGLAPRDQLIVALAQITSTGCEVIQTSTCLNRCFNVCLKSLKKARCSGKSGTSTKNRVRLSRKVAPSCSQEPCTNCVSQEAAPNRTLNSAKVCASKVSGTGLPSLNSNGTRISYRRNELIGGG